MGLGRGARCPSLDEPRSRNYFGHDCAGWLHDIKHDGLRVIGRKNGMRVFHATANPALVSKRMTAASNKMGHLDSGPLTPARRRNAALLQSCCNGPQRLTASLP